MIKNKCIKNENHSKSRLFITGINSLMYKIEAEDNYEDFSGNKELFNFSNDSTKPKYYNDSNKSFIVKINDKNAAVRLKPKIYLFLVEDDSEHKKAKSININFN